MKSDTLVSEIPQTESGLVFYIKSLSAEIGKFVSEGASESAKILHRRQKYLMRKSQDRLNKIFESKNQYSKK